MVSAVVLAATLLCQLRLGLILMSHRVDHMSVEKEARLQDHRRKLTLLGAIGMPFYIALALGGIAYFKGNAVLPLLADQNIAFNVFLIGAAGAFVDAILSGYQVIRIKALENEPT